MLRVTPADYLQFTHGDAKDCTLELACISSNPVTYKVSQTEKLPIKHFKLPFKICHRYKQLRRKNSVFVQDVVFYILAAQLPSTFC